MSDITCCQNEIQSVFHVYIPFHTQHPSLFRAKAVSGGWKMDNSLDTGFYLGYIKRIFNRNGINSDCLVLKKEYNEPFTLWFTPTKSAAFSIDGIRLFCFDTSAAFLELRIPYTCSDLGSVADLSAGFRVSDKKSLSRGGDPDLCINDIAHEILKGLGKYTLFDHLGSAGATRSELFVTLVMDDTEEDLTIPSYRIANGLDNRYAEMPENTVQYSMFHHLRWTITDRGVCNIGLRTGDEKNDVFVCSQWPRYTEQRYVIWYILALHQKYALYRFLNDIAERHNVNNLKFYQERIMVFNTKYRFSIISEEVSYQTLYTYMSESIGLETQFNDIDEEVERITEYYESVSAKNNTISMTIISLVCAVTVIREFYDLVAVDKIMDSLRTALSALSAGGMILYGIFCIILLFALFVLIPKSGFFLRVKKIYETILQLLFRKKL